MLPFPVYDLITDEPTVSLPATADRNSTDYFGGLGVIQCTVTPLPSLIGSVQVV